MRTIPQHGSTGADASAVPRQPRNVSVGTVALIGGFLAAVAAVLYPVAAVGTVGAAVLARRTVRAALDRRRARRRAGRDREICIPGTGVCVEA